MGFRWAEGSGGMVGMVGIVCLVVAGARGWDCLVLVLVWFGWFACYDFAGYGFARGWGSKRGKWREKEK